MFCWGDDNNSQDTIKYLKSLGMHGIIYDKMDKLSTKTDKVRKMYSIFWTPIWNEILNYMMLPVNGTLYFKEIT